MDGSKSSGNLEAGIENDLVVIPRLTGEELKSFKKNPLKFVCSKGKWFKINEWASGKIYWGTTGMPMNKRYEIVKRIANKNLNGWETLELLEGILQEKKELVKKINNPFQQVRRQKIKEFIAIVELDFKELLRTTTKDKGGVTHPILFGKSKGTYYRVSSQQIFIGKGLLRDCLQHLTTDEVIGEISRVIHHETVHKVIHLIGESNRASQGWDYVETRASLKDKEQQRILKKMGWRTKSIKQIARQYGHIDVLRSLGAI